MSTPLVIPDIGDFRDVEVIEILVKVGDTIQAEQSLLTVESDKASMEIPASQAGVVESIIVKLGDKVNAGVPILTVTPLADSGSASAAPSASPTEAATVAPVVAPPSASAAASTSATVSADAFDVVVLGGGPGGYSAAFRAADLGCKVAIVERYPTLGGVCLNVGCIPSKALLHNAAILEEAQGLAQNGIHFSAPKVDIDGLRTAKNGVVKQLTTGLAGMAKARKVEVMNGVAAFTDSHHLTVTTDSGTQTIAFKHAIIAVGSEAVKLPFAPDDPRIVTSTGALNLPLIPGKMLLIGGGIISLEMGTVYSSLGARLDVVEMLDGLMQGADRDAVKIWQKQNQHRFDNIWLGTKTTAIEARPDGVWVTFEGQNAPTEPQRYDLVLQAVGRRPNGNMIQADRAGVQVDAKGFIPVDKQMRTNVPHIFAIGDVVGQPMLAHKAVHEGHVAAEVIAGEKAFFDARVIPSVAYTHPEVAWVGVTEDAAKQQSLAIEKGLFPWAASGRAIANGASYGYTKLIFDATTKHVIGGIIVGPNAGDMIGEVALAIEMGADAVDIGKTIHPHPTLGESIGMAAEVAEGACTDLPPQRKR